MAEAPGGYSLREVEMNTDDRYGFKREYRKQKLNFRDMEVGTEDNKESKRGKTSEEQNNPFNMTAKNFPKRRSRMHPSVASYNRTRGSTVSANKALELVRAALQPSLNAEIESVLKSYQEMFRMAARNIKDNTSEPVSEEQIKAVLRRSLDEAKVLFRMDNKIHPDSRMRYERGGSPAVVKKKRSRPDPDKESDESSPAKSNKLESRVITFDWKPDELNENTEFVMGVKANKALGMAATRGKIYYRHPELFKYSGDSDDKLWLYEQNELPITGGKAFLMIADDIRKLANHEDYRNVVGLNLEEIKGFKVPPKMLEKIRNHMRKLKREAESRFDIKSKVKEEQPTVKVEQKVEEERKQTETRPSGNSSDQN